MLPRKADASVEVVRVIRQVLLNESETVLLPVTDEDHPDERPRRQVVRSQSQEAVRAEIQKNIGLLLLQLETAHPVLAERKVDIPRLERLHSAALALTGRLATRTARKGKAKSTTRSLHGIVAEQRREWGTIYRLLRLAAQADPRIAELLAAARKR
jgi:hypothetical protein